MNLLTALRAKLKSALSSGVLAKMTGGKGLPGMRVREDFRLSVLSPGSPVQSRTLEPGSYVIGGDRNADIIVITEAEGDYVRLDLSYRDGTSYLEAVAIAPDVIIDDEQTQPGEMRKANALMTILVAGTRITISGRDEPKSQAKADETASTEQKEEEQATASSLMNEPEPQASPSEQGAQAPRAGNQLPAIIEKPAPTKLAAALSLANPNFRRAALFLGLSLLAGIAATVISGPDSNAVKPVTDPREALVEPNSSTADATAELRRLIRLADLQERIVVTDTGARVEAKGFIGGTETRRWQDILMKMRDKTRVVIDNRVRLAPGEAVIGRLIAGVVTDPVRHVVDRNGAHFRPGDTMPDGWTIVEISTSTVILSKDGAEERLDY